MHDEEINLRGVGGDEVISNLHSKVSGFGLHISVPSHVTIVTTDTYPASHWIVIVDPGNLLETGPKAPFMGLSEQDSHLHES